MSQETRRAQVRPPEREHEGPIWTHPYFLYCLLTLALVFVLLAAGWLAWENGWIPSRGIGSP